MSAGRFNGCNWIDFVLCGGGDTSTVASSSIGREAAGSWHSHKSWECKATSASASCGGPRESPRCKCVKTVKLRASLTLDGTRWLRNVKHLRSLFQSFDHANFWIMCGKLHVCKCRTTSFETLIERVDDHCHHAIRMDQYIYATFINCSFKAYLLPYECHLYKNVKHVLCGYNNTTFNPLLKQYPYKIGLEIGGTKSWWRYKRYTGIAWRRFLISKWARVYHEGTTTISYHHNRQMIDVNYPTLNIQPLFHSFKQDLHADH